MALAGGWQEDVVTYDTETAAALVTNPGLNELPNTWSQSHEGRYGREMRLSKKVHSVLTGAHVTNTGHTLTPTCTWLPSYTVKLIKLCP